MTFEELKDFVNKGMRMSHVYQPVMLMTLLRNGGKCDQEKIASALLAEDESQQDYYVDVTRNMVGRVLVGHGIVSREGGMYQLENFSLFSEEEIETIISICQGKLEEYKEKRGARIWDHRRKSSGYVSGTLRYEIFKRAKFHCELCGIPGDEKALEVDHIVPRNKGGGDDLDNLQALCYTCNAMKRDRDDTDFHAVRESFENNDSDCPFCSLPRERIVAEERLAVAISDAYPVTKGHTLIIPKRHTPDYFDLGQSEINACTRLLKEMKEELRGSDDGILGFNLGVNVGEHAGQTVGHCHIHLIPRRDGDVADPIGGIRNIFPGKGKY